MQRIAFHLWQLTFFKTLLLHCCVSLDWPGPLTACVIRLRNKIALNLLKIGNWTDKQARSQISHISTGAKDTLAWCRFAFASSRSFPFSLLPRWHRSGCQSPQRRMPLMGLSGRKANVKMQRSNSDSILSASSWDMPGLMARGYFLLGGSLQPQQSMDLAGPSMLDTNDFESYMSKRCQERPSWTISGSLNACRPLTDVPQGFSRVTPNLSPKHKEYPILLVTYRTYV